jgi:hypothetical protein
VRVTRLAFAPGPQCLVEFPDVGAPSYEWVGDGLSSSTVDGEEAYGPNHPMPFPPVISNGICRIAWDSFEDGLRYAFANRPPGQTNNVVLRDQGVFTFHSSTSDLESGNFKLESLRSWDVLEWTPERAVVRYTVFSTNVNSVYGETTDVYVTLQRGWTGPRIEAYTPNAQDDGNVGIAFGAQPSPNNPGHVSAFCGTTGGTGQHMSMSLASTGGVNWPLMTTVDARFRAAFSPMSINDPAFACIPDDPSRAVVTMCPVRGTHIAYQFFSGTSEGGRKGIALGQPSSPNAGYVGCQVGATPNWAGSSVHGYAVEAESVMNPAGTRTSVADAAGTGGNAVNDTQTSNAANTVVQTIAAANPAQSVRVSLWVRGRVTTGGDTGSFAATGFPTTATTTSTTYVWLYLGEAVVSTSAAFNIAIQAWRSAGAGTTGIRVDRYVAIPVSRTDLTGVRDHGQASLADCRQVPELVAR